MKAISIIYAFMLFICAISGLIVALMCKCSLWWWLLFLFLVPWIWIPSAELRTRVPLRPGFSAVLFVVSFAVLAVLVTAAILLTDRKSFLSIMSIVALCCAFLLTVWFVTFLPKNEKLEKKGEWLDYVENNLKNRCWGSLHRFF